MLHLPPRAAVATLQSRVLPKACFGAALLLVRPDWQTRLNAVQDRWLMQLFGLTVKRPRISLLAAVGKPRRLSTLVAHQAMTLLARMQSCSVGSETFKIHVLAKQCPVSWSSAVLNFLARHELPSWLEFCDCNIPTERSEYKRLLAQYKQLGSNVLQSCELAWQVEEEQGIGLSNIPAIFDANSWPELDAWATQHLGPPAPGE